MTWSGGSKLKGMERHTIIMGSASFMTYRSESCDNECESQCSNNRIA